MLKQYSALDGSEILEQAYISDRREHLVDRLVGPYIPHSLFSTHIQKRLKQKMRLPELLMTRPELFYYLATHHVFEGELGYHAWLLDCKSRHIKPPKGSAAFGYEFNKSRELQTVFLLKKAGKGRLKPGVQYVKHLDLSLFSFRGSSGDRPRKRVMKLMSKLYFDGQPPTKRQCWEFFGNDDNFDLSCRETHFPKAKRRHGPPRAIPRY